jgi:hypothetical protein
MLSRPTLDNGVIGDTLIFHLPRPDEADPTRMMSVLTTGCLHQFHHRSVGWHSDKTTFSWPLAGSRSSDHCELCNTPLIKPNIPRSRQWMGCHHTRQLEIFVKWDGVRNDGMISSCPSELDESEPNHMLLVIADVRQTSLFYIIYEIYCPYNIFRLSSFGMSNRLTMNCCECDSFLNRLTLKLLMSISNISIFTMNRNENTFFR